MPLEAPVITAVRATPRANIRAPRCARRFRLIVPSSAASRRRIVWAYLGSLAPSRGIGKQHSLEEARDSPASITSLQAADALIRGLAARVSAYALVRKMRAPRASGFWGFYLTSPGPLAPRASRWEQGLPSEIAAVTAMAPPDSISGGLPQPRSPRRREIAGAPAEIAGRSLGALGAEVMPIGASIPSPKTGCCVAVQEEHRR